VASCDLAVAAESAGFAAPGGKGGWFCHTPMVAIARNVGRKRAMELALTGDVIDARTALDWGLVNRVVPDDELDKAVDDLMARATRGSRASKAWGKQSRREPDPRRSGGDGRVPREAAPGLDRLTWTARQSTAR
jgi:enoyl-CoA hydratase/carnithine racemase